MDPYNVYRNNRSWSKRAINNRSTGIIVPPGASSNFVSFYESQQQQQNQNAKPREPQPNIGGRSYSMPMQTVNSAGSLNEIFPTKSIRVRHVSINSADRDRSRFPQANQFRVVFPYALPATVRIRVVGLEMPNISMTVDRENTLRYEIPGDSEIRAVAIERGNYDTDSLFTALQRAVAREDEFLRIEGSVDPITQVSSVQFFTMVKLDEDALNFATPLRVQFELPSGQMVPQIGDNVLLSNIDARELQDGIFPVEGVFSKVSTASETSGERKTYVRIRVPYTSNPAPDPSTSFGGKSIYCGLPFPVKLDLSADDSLARTLGLARERSSVFLTPNEAITLPQYRTVNYKMTLLDSHMATLDGTTLAVFIQAFDIPNWFRGQHVVLRQGTSIRTMEVLETEPRFTRVWLRDIALSDRPVGDTIAMLGPLETNASKTVFRVANIRDVVVRSATQSFSGDPETIRALTVNWLTGVGTAYRMFVYTSDVRIFSKTIYTLENWPLGNEESAEITLLCWSPVFRRADSCGSYVIFRFGTDIFDNIAKFGKIMYPIIRDDPFDLALVSERKVLESSTGAAVPSVPLVFENGAAGLSKVWRTDRAAYAAVLDAETVPDWIAVGNVVSLRASGTGSAFVTWEDDGKKHYELLESLGFLEVLEIDREAKTVYLGHSFVEPSPAPDPLPDPVPLTVPKARIKLSNTPNMIDLEGQIVTFVSANNGVVLGAKVPLLTDTEDALNNPYRTSAHAAFYGCSGITFRFQSVGSEFRTRLFDPNTYMLFMANDANSLSWGNMADVAVEQDPLDREVLIPMLTYKGVDYELQSMAYFMSEDDGILDGEDLVCVFLLPPYIGVPANDAERSVTIRSNAILRGRTNAETFALSEFDRIAFVEEIPQRTAQAVWLTRSNTLTIDAGLLPSMDLPTLRHIGNPDTNAKPLQLRRQTFDPSASIEMTIPQTGPFCNFAQRIRMDWYDDTTGFLAFGADNYTTSDEAAADSSRFSSQAGTSFRPFEDWQFNCLVPRTFVQLIEDDGTVRPDCFVQLASKVPSTVSNDTDEIAIVDLLAQMPTTGGGFGFPDTRSLLWEQTTVTAYLPLSIETNGLTWADLARTKLFVPNLMQVDVPGHGLNQLRCIKPHPLDANQLVIHTLLPPDFSAGDILTMLLKYEQWVDGMEDPQQSDDEVRCTVNFVNRERRWALVTPMLPYQVQFPLSYGLIGANADRIDFYNVSTRFDSQMFVHPNIQLAGVLDEHRLLVSFGDKSVIQSSDVTNDGGSGVRVSHPNGGFKSRHTNIGVNGELTTRSRMDVSEFDYLYLSARVPGYVGNHQIGMFSTSQPREEFIVAKIILTQSRAILYNSFVAQDMVFLPTLAAITELELRLLWPDGRDVSMTDDYSLVLEIDEIADILSNESVIPANPPKE